MLNREEICRKYFIRFASRLQKVTSPLKDHFGIPFFGYHRIDTEGKYTVLTDRPDWAEHYLAEKLYINDPYLMHPSEYSGGVCLFSHVSTKKNRAFNEAWKSRLEAEEGVVIIEKDSTAVEFFIFAGQYQSDDFSKLYLNHLPLLRAFSKHFKKEVHDILEKQQKEDYTLTFSQNRDKKQVNPKVDLKKKESFIRSLKQEKNLNQYLSLTPREKDCLKQILGGKTIKEIAAALSLSSRTVEYYLENVKNKTGCLSKQELISRAKLFHSFDLL